MFPEIIWDWQTFFRNKQCFFSSADIKKAAETKQIKYVVVLYYSITLHTDNYEKIFSVNASNSCLLNSLYLFVSNNEFNLLFGPNYFCEIKTFWLFKYVNVCPGKNV